MAISPQHTIQTWDKGACCAEFDCLDRYDPEGDCLFLVPLREYVQGLSNGDLRAFAYDRMNQNQTSPHTLSTPTPSTHTNRTQTYIHTHTHTCTDTHTHTNKHAHTYTYTRSGAKHKQKFSFYLEDAVTLEKKLLAAKRAGKLMPAPTGPDWSTEGRMRRCCQTFFLWLLGKSKKWLNPGNNGEMAAAKHGQRADFCREEPGWTRDRCATMKASVLDWFDQMRTENLVMPNEEYTILPFPSARVAHAAYVLEMEARAACLDGGLLRRAHFQRPQGSGGVCGPCRRRTSVRGLSQDMEEAVWA